jgi:hypothetical protein
MYGVAPVMQEISAEGRRIREAGRRQAGVRSSRAE